MQSNRNELHVWVAGLGITLQQLGELESTLTADEIARADQFHFERDRHSFVAARGILRTIIASYVEVPPSVLRFLYNEFGKPRLEGSQDSRNLSFNMSHSGRLALIAVALAREVGVDIETIDESVRIGEVAKSFFSANEVASLERLPQSLEIAGFFNCWTRKEAYIKARGMGLSIPLDSFDVSLNPGEPAALIATRDSSDISNWKIENLDIDSGYPAAVAASDHDWSVSRWYWR